MVASYFSTALKRKNRFTVEELYVPGKHSVQVTLSALCSNFTSTSPEADVGITTDVADTEFDAVFTSFLNTKAYQPLLTLNELTFI